MVKRRGARIDPPNRFERLCLAADPESTPIDDGPLRVLPTEFFVDDSRSIVSENDSPDIPFRYSVNPYRGCEHGCAYCYARPSHEYLGYSAGLDFETKVLVKPNAAQLLKRFLSRRDYHCEPVVLSGVTDCYQPIERRLGITRQLLEVCRDAGQPVRIVTKNALVARDVDILAEMARRRLVEVALSISTMNESLARRMEPRASAPALRLRTIGTLARAQIPVRVMCAPVVPGLTDADIATVLASAAAAGASSAGYTLLRLPGNVRAVFTDWLTATYPRQSDKVLRRIRQTRGGRLNDPRFGNRMRGTGIHADQIAAMFAVFRRRSGLRSQGAELDCSAFRSPGGGEVQLELF